MKTNPQYLKLQWPVEFIGKWVPIHTAVRENPGDYTFPLLGNMDIMCFDDKEHAETFLKAENMRRKKRNQYEIKCEFVQATETYPRLGLEVYICGRDKEELKKDIGEQIEEEAKTKV